MNPAEKALAKAQRRAESKLFDVLRAYRQVKRRVNSQDVSDPMDKQMTMLEMMKVNVEYIRTKIEDLAESLRNASLLSHGSHNNSNRSRRRLSGITPSASTSSLSGSVASNAGAQPTQQPQHHQQQQQQQSTHLPLQPVHQQSPATSTIQEVDEAAQMDDMSDDNSGHHHFHRRQHDLHHHHHVDGPPARSQRLTRRTRP